MDATKTEVREATAADAAAVARIYDHFVRDTVVTFEEEAPSTVAMAARMAANQGEWLVATEGRRVVGFAYANGWKARGAYRFSVETTVYVDVESPRRGVGTKLYTELFRSLEARGVHAVMSGIVLPNDASVALHERFGMRKVAHFAEVGFKFGRWLDVGYWQRVLGR